MMKDLARYYSNLGYLESDIDLILDLERERLKALYECSQKCDREGCPSNDLEYKLKSEEINYYYDCQIGIIESKYD